MTLPSETHTYSRFLHTVSQSSDAIGLKLVGKQERMGGDSQLFLWKWVKELELDSSALPQLLVSASGYFLQIDRVSIVNVLGKVKMRAKDEAGSSEVAEEA